MRGVRERELTFGTVQMVIPVLDRGYGDLRGFLCLISCTGRAETKAQL